MLVQVKKRRRLSRDGGMEDTNHVSKMTGSSSLSTFVQSALKWTPNERVERRGDQDSRHKGTSTSRKKQRLGIIICIHTMYVYTCMCVQYNHCVGVSTSSFT